MKAAVTFNLADFESATFVKSLDVVFFASDTFDAVAKSGVDLAFNARLVWAVVKVLRTGGFIAFFTETALARARAAGDVIVWAR